MPSIKMPVQTIHKNDHLLDDTEAIIIITMEYIRSHESEHGHDVVQNRLRSNTSEAGNK